MYKNALNECFVLPLQELNGANSKFDVPPLSLSGFSPTTQIRTILYKIIRRSWGRDTNAIDFVTIASSLLATSGTRIDRDNSLVMPPSFVRQLRNNTAQSDGATVKLGAHILAAVAARTPNRHIPCISTL